MPASIARTQKALPRTAIVASLAVHGALLALPGWHATTKPAPQALMLRLPPVVASNDAKPAAAVSAAGRVPPAPRIPAKPAPTIVERRQPPAQSEPRADAPTIPDAAQATTAAIATDAELLPARAGPRAPTPPAPTAVPAAAADGAALARYAARLGELLASRQQYPRLAATRGWEGEVRLRLQLAASGAMLSVNLLRSSGHAILDEHALALVRAATLPPPPTGAATNGELLVDVPILYSLKDTS